MVGSAPSMIEVATRYAGRGWSVIPIPYRSKNPGFRGWEQLRLTEADLPERFNGAPQNVGVLLGAPSGWLIDVDLDHHRALELAPDHLPATLAVFGRSSKPRSHWIYCVSAPLVTKKFRSKSSGMIVELRSTGMQTVFPPSVHESGEPIEWEVDGAEPALVDPVELLTAVSSLATAVLVELGEKSPPRQPKKRAAPAPAVPEPAAEVYVESEERARRCLAAMLRLDVYDARDGSSRLYTAACRVVEHDLEDTAGIAVIRRYARDRPFPKHWSDEQIVKRIRDAERVCRRGAALQPDYDEDRCIRLGTRDPASGKLVLSPRKTLPTAEAYVREFHLLPEGRTIQGYADQLMVWHNNHFAAIEDQAARHRLQPWLHDALRYVKNPRTEEMELIGFDSNPTAVEAALKTIKAYVHLPANTELPCWLGDPEGRPPTDEILPCRSVLLHLPTMNLLEPTPRLFTTCALDFDPDHNAPEPMTWFRFLHELFDDDIQSQELLQHFIGYCLTPNTAQQKMLLLVGPRRSGKGTIARIIRRLIGAANVCGPTTGSLAGQFGLQPLIGKSVAIVSDARFAGENISTVVERLLCISGEDALTIDRKYLPSVTLKLPTRFIFLTNELPRLTDSSNALAGRFMILRLTRSFYGEEDPTLTDKLLAELPGILNWAIEGWRGLRERGYFVMPQSVEDAVRDLEELSSPVSAFVRDECLIGPGHRAWIEDLYAGWKRWCDREGRTKVTNRQTFGRDLLAAFPVITSRRHRQTGRFYDGIALKGERG